MHTDTDIQILKLSQLTGCIAVLVNTFQQDTHWVIADVSNHTFYPGKEHHYFELVEKEEGDTSIIAKAQAVAWRAGSSKIKVFEKTTGQRTIIGVPFAKQHFKMVEVSLMPFGKRIFDR